ncbi:hypothetical protein DLAC_05709 [Tieghemostelium lacteum]|uniref:Arpin n=1 Tax=Tieghemostelium lacteum TaxID=361077 RepID=A0A151ZGP2_TIELA|nr:hypothetical protein DLAC_05709 [Tieghemostelium lacteum]|eukprot:KYQ93087.1 hypothetical protein DLAC_05709 [Tieghemostelium lacteum]
MTSTEFSQHWTKEHLCKGDGFIIEGVVKGSKVHNVFVTSKQNPEYTALPTRFLAVTMVVDSIIKRNWNKDGYEIPPKMTRGTAISKGYLNKFDRIQSTPVDKLDCNQMANLIANGNALPHDFHDDVLKNLHPHVPNTFEFWLDMEKFNHKDIKAGDEVRIKTIGNSVIVQEYVRMDQSQISNFSGDKDLGTNFVKNINKFKDSDENNEPQQDDDDDEWK